MKWSESQVQAYREQGFLFMRGLLSAQETLALTQSLPSLLLGSEERDGMHREKEKSGAVRSVFLAHRHDPAYREFARNPKILAPVKQLLDNDVYVWHSKINVKDAFEGAVWLWHQDYGYWMWDGVDPKFVSVMVLLDRA